jgi:phosphoribosylamine--glycine ligase
VVIAAAGYPDAPRQGDAIEQLPADTDDCVVFHAGTQLRDGKLVTSGGRVLTVTALGDSVHLAHKRAYEAVAQVRFDGMQFRRDIGHRALKSRG